jgi:hypothetical protein
MELRNQPPSSHLLTAPVHPPERVTGPPELHHSEGRYRSHRDSGDQQSTHLNTLSVPRQSRVYLLDPVGVEAADCREHCHQLHHIGE